MNCVLILGMAAGFLVLVEGLLWSMKRARADLVRSERKARR